MGQIFLPGLLPPPPPLPIARHPFDPTWPEHDLGSFTITCLSCGALHWLDEHLSSSSKTNPKFGICCYSGKISLPFLHPLPQELHHLFTTSDDRGKAFCHHIHNYNNALAMTSVGRDVDDTLNNGGGPWIFKLHGELTHKIGSLLPPSGSTPSYAQLYIHDTEEALQHRMNNRYNSALDPATMWELQDVLYHCHPAVQLYKQAAQLTAHLPPDQQ
jgi:hypothetical protein